MTGLLIALIFVALGVGIAVGTRLRLSRPTGGGRPGGVAAPARHAPDPVDPVPVDPVAVDPVAVDPVAVDPLPGETVPVDPVLVEPADPVPVDGPPAASPEGGSGDGIADPPAAGSDRADRVVSAVWRLQCLDLERSRRREAGLSTAAGTDEGPIGLAQAVEEEIARTREEIGTPGAFRSDLEVEPDPAGALLLLRSVQSTLDFVARRSQAFDLHLHPADGALAVTVVCDDFEGDIPAASATAGDTPDATAMAEVIASAGAALAFDRDADGRMRAQLRVEVV